MNKQLSQVGYVAIEFVVAMGLLVLPTSMIVLQIPRLLEQHDRVSALASSVSYECAYKANSMAQAQEIANETAIKEMSRSNVLQRAQIISSTCSSSTSSITPGSIITSNVTVSVDAPLIAFFNSSYKLNVHENNSVRVPKYRSID